MTVAIRKVVVHRTQRKISQGQSVNISIEIIDAGYSSPLFNPTSSPLISIYNPLDVLIIDNAPMTEFDVGIYSYTYQSAIDDEVGVYTCTFNVVDDTNLAIIEKISTFEIKAIQTPTSELAFNYLAIKDQNNVVWYWFIDIDNTLNAPNPSIPAVVGKVPIGINLGVVPNWLEIENPTPEVRYVYPDVDGTALVSASEPAVGSGHIGSPTFISAGGGSFVLDVNLADEVNPATV